MIIAEHIRRVCTAGGDSFALEFDGAILTWRALSEAVAGLRAVLGEARLPPNAAVGLLGRNRLAPIAAFIVSLGAGRSVVLINVSRSSKLVAEEIAQLRLGCVIGEPGDLTQDVIDAASASGALVVAASASGGRLSFDPLTAFGGGDFRPAADDILFEIQTSGTTGKPKRIPIKESTLADSLKDGVRSASGTVEQKTLSPKSSPTLLFAPLVHTSGAFITLMSVFEVRPMVVLEKFNPEKYRDALVKHKVKFAPLPPTAMKMLFDSSATKKDFENVIAVRSGTAPLPVELQIEFEKKFGVPVLTNYGATEFMGAVTGWTLDDYRKLGEAKRGSVGRPSKGVQIRVVDPSSFDPLPSGEQGVLEVRLDRLDGGKNWLRTTDLASIDEDGFLFIHGRTDDAIIRGGFKVMAGKIADAVKQYEGVYDAIVLGWPDERLGQVPIAVVEPYKGSAKIVVEDLKAFVKEKLTAYEAPARYYIVDKLPRTVSEKISRPETIALVEKMDARSG